MGMLSVADIMTRKVESLAAETTLREAMELLSTHHFGGAPVLAGDKVIGVMSMSDVLGFLINTPQEDAVGDNAADAHDFKASNDEADEEADLHLTAVSEELWDAWPRRTGDSLEVSSPHGESVLDRYTVADAMNAEVFSVSPQVTAREAARLMQERGIHRLLVLTGGRLVGIVSALDVARAVSNKGFGGERGINLRLHPPQPGRLR
jgi:CBS domain-containing protein